MEYAPFIKQILQETSDIAIEKFGKVASKTKKEDPSQVVTETDLFIGQTIIKKIQKVYKDYNIIDEEAGAMNKNSAFTWVIDPIDGTSNYAAGIPLYGIFLGLLYRDTPIAGGIALPAFSEIYIAEKGKGAYCNNTKLQVAKTSDLSTVLIAFGIEANPGHPEETKKDCRFLADIIVQARNVRSSNSAFDVAMVAKGSYGGTVNIRSKIWDNVAAHSVIEEAGGTYTDFYGKPMNYTQALLKTKENFTCCAAAPAIHTQLQKIIQKYQ